MASFFLMGCGGSKFTVAEDEFGLPLKRDAKKGEKIRTKDSTNESHGIDNGSKETTLQKEVRTYEVKLVNNRLVQQVTTTSPTGKNSTITNQGNIEADYDNIYEDGSPISNFNDDSLTRSPSFREYCNTDDSNIEASDDRESGIENLQKVEKINQPTKNEISIAHVTDDKKVKTNNDDNVPHENEDTKKNESTNRGSTNKDGIGIRLRKVFPIHMIQVVKLTNMRKKSSQ